MSGRIRLIHIFAVLTLAPLAACSGSVASPGPTLHISPAPTASSNPARTAPSSPDDREPLASSDPGAATPATTSPPTPGGASFDQPWAVAALTDVSTGEQFRLADLAASGKVVFVETMAIWCTNCHAQQVAAVAALDELDPATVEWVVLDVETAETAEALARYREQNAFPFRYAIADTALSRSLADQFGDVVLSPPTVNVIVLGTDGRISHLRGHHEPADLVALAIDHGS